MKASRANSEMYTPYQCPFYNLLSSLNTNKCLPLDPTVCAITLLKFSFLIKFGLLTVDESVIDESYVFKSISLTEVN